MKRLILFLLLFVFSFSVYAYDSCYQLSTYGGGEWVCFDNKGYVTAKPPNTNSFGGHYTINEWCPSPGSMLIEYLPSTNSPYPYTYPRNIYCQVNTCPEGTNNENGYCVIPPPPQCPEPPLHPCDTRDPLKAGFCKTNVTWDDNQCQWKANNCGWEGMSNFGGYYYSDFLDPVKNGNTVCMFGCAFNHDETWAGTPPVYHISANGQFCIPDTPEPDPTEPPPQDNIQSDDGDTWEPDDNPNTYCGEFNGQYVCVDSVPDNTCVSTPGGNIVCVGSPAPKPDTVKQPPPDPDLGGTIGDGNYYFYDNDTIIGGGGLRTCPEGYTLEDGICVKAPVDGECPPGSTLQGGKCVYTDLGQWGEFSPPSGETPSFPEIPDYDYSTSLTNAFNALSSANILNIQLNCSSSNFQCPTLSIMGVTTDIHCDLINMALPYLQYALWGIAGILAIRLFLTA